MILMKNLQDWWATNEELGGTYIVYRKVTTKTDPTDVVKPQFNLVVSDRSFFNSDKSWNNLFFKSKIVECSDSCDFTIKICFDHNQF